MINSARIIAHQNLDEKYTNGLAIKLPIRAIGDGLVLSFSCFSFGFSIVAAYNARLATVPPFYFRCPA